MHFIYGHFSCVTDTMMFVSSNIVLKSHPQSKRWKNKDADIIIAMLTD